MPAEEPRISSAGAQLNADLYWVSGGDYEPTTSDVWHGGDVDAFAVSVDLPFYMAGHCAVAHPESQTVFIAGAGIIEEARLKVPTYMFRFKFAGKISQERRQRN